MLPGLYLCIKLYRTPVVAAVEKIKGYVMFTHYWVLVLAFFQYLFDRYLTVSKIFH